MLETLSKAKREPFRCRVCNVGVAQWPLEMVQWGSYLVVEFTCPFCTGKFRITVNE